MQGESAISITQNPGEIPPGLPVLDAQLSATAMTFVGAHVEGAFEDNPINVDEQRKKRRQDGMSTKAVHNLEKEAPPLTAEEREALRRAVFRQFTTGLDEGFFKIASKDILAVNRQFKNDLSNETLKLGKKLPCDEIIKENMAAYRPFMSQFQNEMTPEMFALKQLGMPLEFNHVQ